MDPSINRIKASDGTGNASIATVQSLRSPLASTIIVDTTEGIPPYFFGTMGTPHTFVDPVTGETITVISEATAVDFAGHIDGSNLEIDEIATGYTDNGSAADDIVIIKPTTQYADNLADVLDVSLNDDGTLKAVVANQGWTDLTYQPNTVVANGNRSYDITIPATDVTNILSPGMRLKTTRTVAAPTQCTSLNGTTQYYSKAAPAGMTFTDDFVVSAWVKVSSYANGAIISRHDGTNGWFLYMNSSGQVFLNGTNANIANYSRVISYQSLPLNKWVHVTAQLDMSAFTATTTTSYIMIDGVDVPASVSRAGTNPTATGTQAGNLEVGAYNGATDPFPGKIAQAAVFNAKVTQATMRGYISQGLAGTETSLISAYSFNNSINDLNANANNLTANGSAVATNADSPFGGQAGGTISSTLDYGIIQSVSFSTNTTVVVQVPEGCTIPTSGGVSAVSYSTQKAPYGFPAQQDKWQLLTVYIQAETVTFAALSQWYSCHCSLTLPIGAWKVGYNGLAQLHSSVSGGRNGVVALSNPTYFPTANGVYTNPLISQVPYVTGSSDAIGTVTSSYELTTSAQSVCTIVSSIFSSTGAETFNFPSASTYSTITADNAYL